MAVPKNRVAIIETPDDYNSVLIDRGTDLGLRAGHTEATATQHEHTDLQRVPIEQVQNYWDRRPCNIRHSTRPPGTRIF